MLSMRCIRLTAATGNVCTATAPPLTGLGGNGSLSAETSLVLIFEEGQLHALSVRRKVPLTWWLCFDLMLTDTLCAIRGGREAAWKPRISGHLSINSAI